MANSGTERRVNQYGERPSPYDCSINRFRPRQQRRSATPAGHVNPYDLGEVARASSWHRQTSTETVGEVNPYDLGDIARAREIREREG